ncbi:hypothetical protein M199_gp009 [Halogranum tailed virus 1]|uniref:Uncharacterized protein n=1 Tax=Halogranum tailed virus 1 TaxID=1273749 RepID=R4T6L3_9CAUD|nr:hypothetical protein M199_gp009 [Halogranum tailed virus 1]AGM11339.1 hypothetical protein HGTV1_9 [Halogranum tailed virus 1]
MAKEIYNKDNTELTTAEDTTSIVTASSLDSAETLIHYYNGTDAEVTFVISGSRGADDDFTEAVQLNSEAVASGGNAGYYVVSEPWDQVEISVTPTTDPTSGSVQIYRMDGN